MREYCRCDVDTYRLRDGGGKNYEEEEVRVRNKNKKTEKQNGKRNEPKEHRKECEGRRARGKWKKQRREPQGRNLTLPSVGLIASGKLSHGRVQIGKG